jgi:hypothetical protein
MDRPKDDLAGCFWAIAVITALVVISGFAWRAQDQLERQRIREELRKVLDERKQLEAPQK